MWGTIGSIVVCVALWACHKAPQRGAGNAFGLHFMRAHISTCPTVHDKVYSKGRSRSGQGRWWRGALEVVVTRDEGGEVVVVTRDEGGEVVEVLGTREGRWC